MPDYWLDSDSLIQTKNGPYGFDIAPTFWNFIEQKMNEGVIASSIMVYGELENGDEDDLPTVYVPTHEVRELRSLFTTYKMLIKQNTMLKNRVHSLLIQQGYYLGKSNIFHKDIREAIFNLELPETTVFQLEVLYKQIDFLEGQVNEVKERILEKGKSFENEIDKLVSIKGVSVFTAIAIMTDIADIKRFFLLKKKNSSQIISHTIPITRRK